MKFNFIPKSCLSKWSVGFIISFFLIIGIFFILVASGQRGGEKFFDNLVLAIPGILAAAAGISSFVTGIIGIIKNKERSVFVFISTLIGFLVLLFALTIV